jgi:hypothetical protein
MRLRIAQVTDCWAQPVGTWQDLAARWHEAVLHAVFLVHAVLVVHPLEDVPVLRPFLVVLERGDRVGEWRKSDLCGEN